MSKNCTNDGCSCTPNMSIKCSVTSCAHHCQDMDNCGLSELPQDLTSLSLLRQTLSRGLPGTYISQRRRRL